MSEQKRTAIPKYDAIVNICSMPPPMAEEVVSYAHKAANSLINEQDIARYISQCLNKAYPNNAWQVFVGRNFGSYVTYEDQRYIYFYIGQMGFCIFAI